MRRTEPMEYHEIWRAKYQEAKRQYLAEEYPMTDSVASATLYSLGFRGHNLEAEMNHWRDEKYLVRKNKQKTPLDNPVIDS